MNRRTDSSIFTPTRVRENNNSNKKQHATGKGELIILCKLFYYYESNIFVIAIINNHWGWECTLTCSHPHFVQNLHSHWFQTLTQLGRFSLTAEELLSSGQRLFLRQETQEGTISSRMDLWDPMH